MNSGETEAKSVYKSYLPKIYNICASFKKCSNKISYIEAILRGNLAIFHQKLCKFIQKRSKTKELSITCGLWLYNDISTYEN